MSAGGKKLDGVYRLEGEELKICVGIGDDRPTDFVTKPGAKALLLPDDLRSGFYRVLARARAAM